MKLDNLNSNKNRELSKVLETLKSEFAVELDFSDIKSLQKVYETAKEVIKKIKLTESFGKHLETPQALCANLILEAIKLNDQMDNKSMKTTKGKKPVKKNLKESAGIDQAELVLASKSIVDELTTIIEELGNIQIKKLPPIVDRMKVDQGIDAAESYATSTEQFIASALEAVSAAKDGIDNLTLRMSGDVDMASVDVTVDEPVVDDFGVDPSVDVSMDIDSPEVDVVADTGERERKDESINEAQILAFPEKSDFKRIKYTDLEPMSPIGTVDASYDELVSAFGEPTPTAKLNHKAFYTWDMKGDQGKFSIGDVDIFAHADEIEDQKNKLHTWVVSATPASEEVVRTFLDKHDLITHIKAPRKVAEVAKKWKVDVVEDKDGKKVSLGKFRISAKNEGLAKERAKKEVTKRSGAWNESYVIEASEMVNESALPVEISDDLSYDLSYLVNAYVKRAEKLGVTDSNVIANDVMALVKKHRDNYPVLFHDSQQNPDEFRKSIRTMVWDIKDGINNDIKHDQLGTGSDFADLEKKLVSKKPVDVVRTVTVSEDGTSFVKGDVVAHEGKKYTVDKDDASGDLVGIKSGTDYKLVKKNTLTKMKLDRADNKVKVAESVDKKVTLLVETASGKKGTKQFVNEAEARKWMKQKGHLLKKVTKK